MKDAGIYIIFPPTGEFNLSNFFAPEGYYSRPHGLPASS